VLPGRLSHPLDQRPRRAAAARLLVDEQVLQVACVATPERGVEEVVRDADQPPVEADAQGVKFSAVRFGAGPQPPPGRLVLLVRDPVPVERLVPAGQPFPGGPVAGLQRTDLDHGFTALRLQARFRASASQPRRILTKPAWHMGLPGDESRDGETTDRSVKKIIEPNGSWCYGPVPKTRPTVMSAGSRQMRSSLPTRATCWRRAPRVPADSRVTLIHDRRPALTLTRGARNR
jgi:hypothetical protein